MMLFPALRFGLIAATIIIAGFLLAFNIMDGDLTTAEGIGWVTMAVGMVLLYLATRSARLSAPGAVITFTDALMVGATMSIIMTLAWVFGFEIIVGDQLDAMIAGTEWEALFRDPVVRWVIWTSEILPIALVVTLVASLVESRRKPS